MNLEPKGFCRSNRIRIEYSVIAEGVKSNIFVQCLRCSEDMQHLSMHYRGVNNKLPYKARKLKSGCGAKNSASFDKTNLEHFRGKKGTALHFMIILYFPSLRVQIIAI